MYTAAQRQQIIEDMKGQVVKELSWDEEGEYWTLEFESGFETSFRFMTEEDRQKRILELTLQQAPTRANTESPEQFSARYWTWYHGQRVTALETAP